MNQLSSEAQLRVTSRVLRTLASPAKAEALAQKIRSASEEDMNLWAQVRGVPLEQYEIFRAHMRGERNAFTDAIYAVDGKLRPGDVILMTGTSLGSKILAGMQKPLYLKARSSHVALVHADFICIDAIPGAGVSNRLIQDVLADVQPDWRVIRFKGLEDKHVESVQMACSYYLAQPYKIRAGKKPKKDFAYCSELARKVYEGSGLQKTGINPGAVVGPAHFDRLADTHPEWKDVTADARSYLSVCQNYPVMANILAETFIQGLQLNRSRFEERKENLKKAQLAVSQKRLSKEKYLEMVKTVREIENSLHNQFWDTGGLRKPAGAAQAA